MALVWEQEARYVGGYRPPLRSGGARMRTTHMTSAMRLTEFALDISRPASCWQARHCQQCRAMEAKFSYLPDLLPAVTSLPTIPTEMRPTPAALLPRCPPPELWFPE